MNKSARIGIPPLDSMNVVQSRIYEDSVAAMGGPYGPRMVMINHPELAERWRETASVLKAAGFSAAIRELVVLMIAKHWRSDFEWYAHEKQALKAGISREAIEAIRSGKRPAFEDPSHGAVYEYIKALQEEHAVDDETYGSLHGFLGDRGMIEITVLLGHYTTVAMTLLAHRVPLPPGVDKTF